METKRKLWIDVVILLCLMVLVYSLCQPFGRNWDEKKKEMYSGEEGVYLSDPDSYYYLRKAKEYTERGFSSIRLLSKEEDYLRTKIASDREEEVPMMLSALAAGTWYVMHFMGLKISIYWICLRACSAILALCAIPLYCFLRKRLSRFSSIIGTLVVLLSKPYYTHSRNGIFDTDALICFWALVLVLSLYECLLSKSIKKQLCYGVLSVIAVLGLRVTWSMFYVYVAIAIGTSVFALMLTRVILRRKDYWRGSLTIPTLVMIMMVVITLATGYQGIVSSLKDILQPGQIEEAWPNPAAYVSEMSRAPLYNGNGVWQFFIPHRMDVVSYAGGPLLVLALIASFVVAVKRCVSFFRGKTEKRFEEVFLFGAVGLWLVGTAIMTFWGIRFYEFFIAPASILLAFGVHELEQRIVSIRENKTIWRIGISFVAFSVFSTLVLVAPRLAVISASIILLFGFFNRFPAWKYVFLSLLMLAMIAANIEMAWVSGISASPYFCKPLEEAMQWIEENTSDEAVLANEWGLGYAFQYYSGRRTISDGGTYNGGYFYWLATMLSTDNLELSAGIARMLQGSGMDGTNYAIEVCGGKEAAVRVLKEILPISRNEAERYLVDSAGFTNQQSEKLVSLTHCSDEELYLVLESRVLSLVSTEKAIYNWDFNLGSEEQGDTFIGAYSVERPKAGEAIWCEIGIDGEYHGWKAAIKNADDLLEAWLIAPSGQRIDCSRFVYYKDGERLVDSYSEKSVSDEDWVEKEALVLIEDKGRVSVIVCEKEIIDSVYFRLYVCGDEKQGVFTKVFEKAIPEVVSGEPSKTQRFIGTHNTLDYVNCGVMVWKVQ